MAEQVDATTGLAAVEEGSPTRLKDLFSDFAVYERDLDLLGLRDDQLAGRHRRHLTFGWAVLKVVVALPFAAVGVIVHLLPFLLVKQLSKRPANEGIKATVKVLGCFVLFALTYTVVGVIVGRGFGPWAGFLAAVGAPLCGFLAVRMHERVKRIGGVVEGYRIVKGHRDVVDVALAHRAAVVRDVQSALVPS
jgi:hypothetical protein